MKVADVLRMVHVVARQLSAFVTVITVMAVAADVADAADTHMVVPSRATAAQLDALSHKSNIVADVLTVDRTDYMLKLDGRGGGVFSGEGVINELTAQGAASTAVGISIDQMALVYYIDPPAGKKQSTLQFPAKESYPSVAAITAAERTMDCSELDMEIARAGTIRWYARRHGAMPFTEHEARVQHGKNAAYYVGAGLLVMALSGGGGAAAAGGGGFPGFGGGHTAAVIDLETFRWAVTAADRREVSLLRLKGERLCPASATVRGENTDLEILTKIEATLRARDIHEISDQDQMKQQVQLLDQFDPP